MNIFKKIKKNKVYIYLILLALTNLIIYKIPRIAPITLYLFFSPIYIINQLKIIFIHGFEKIEINGLILLFYMFIVNLCFINDVRWNSFLYTIIYVMCFFCLINYSKNLSKENFSYILSSIIILYFINVLCGILLYITIGDNIYTSSIFQYTIDSRTGQIRFSGFSSEPSYSAIIVCCALYIFNKNSKDRKLKYILILVTGLLIVTFNSIYGYLFYFIIILKFINYNKRNSLALTSLFVVIFISVIGVSNKDSRLFALLENSSQVSSIDDLNFLDSSGSMRILPTLLYLDDSTKLMNSLIGHGGGGASVYFGNILADQREVDNTVDEGELINLGVIPAYIYDYGFIGIILLYLLILKNSVNKFYSLDNLLIFLIMLNANINTQIFWFCISIFYLNNYIKKEI